MFRRSPSRLSFFYSSTPILLQRGGGGRTPGEGWYFDSNAAPNRPQSNQKLKSPMSPREATSVNPFAADITAVRRLLVLVNNHSGWKEAQGAFQAHVTETLDKTGVVHKTHFVPPEDLKNVLREEMKAFPSWDGVLICGGDGSVNAYTYCMTLPEFKDYWLKRPISILPAGTNNGVAHSMGLGNAGCTTASFISGRKREVPIWKATVHNYDDPPNSPGTVLSTSLCSVNFGIFADTLMTSLSLKNWLLGFVMLPVPRKRNYLASMYHLARASPTSAMPLSVRYTTLPKKDPKTGIDIPNTGGEVKALPPGKGLHLLMASQMKWHHKGYSLTPKAEYGQMFIGTHYKESLGQLKPWMSVTIADGETSKGRLMHLLQREGPEAELELEDGIETFQCQSLEIGFSPVAVGGGDGSGKKKKYGKKKQKFLLDGEECELLPGQTLKLAPTGINLEVMIP